VRASRAGGFPVLPTAGGAGTDTLQTGCATPSFGWMAKMQER